MQLMGSLQLLQTSNDKYGYTVLHLMCKECDCNFKANTNLLMPENVKHDLGKSMTIICPDCEKSTIAPVHDLAINREALAKEVKKVTDEISTLINALGPCKFNMGILKDNGDIDVTCLACNKVFHSSIKTQEHIKAEVGKDAIASVTCPHCNQVDKFNEERLHSHLELVDKYTKLMQLYYLASCV